MSNKQKKPNTLLRMERKNRGWSQARLAEVLKMFQKYVPESWKDTKQIREITEQYPLLLREIK